VPADVPADVLADVSASKRRSITERLFLIENDAHTFGGVVAPAPETIETRRMRDDA